jgi:hypothetical protein
VLPSISVNRMVVTLDDTSKPKPSVAGSQPTCTLQPLTPAAKWSAGPAARLLDSRV